MNSALLTDEACIGNTTIALNVTNFATLELTNLLNSADCRALLVADPVNATVAVKSIQLAWVPPLGLALRIDTGIVIANISAYATARSSSVPTLRTFGAALKGVEFATNEGRLLRGGLNYFRVGSDFVSPATSLDSSSMTLDFSFSLVVSFFFLSLLYFGKE